MTLFNPADLMMFGFEGSDCSDAIKRVGTEGAFGVILFRRNCISYDQVSKLNEELTSQWPSGRPLVAIDHEGRRVNRLRDFHQEDLGASELGVQDDLHQTERFGAQLGATLSALGVHINFAPVLDLQEFADHPALKGRCFHADPAKVAAHGRALLQSMQKKGVSGCGKHFPGHGSAFLDSHVALPESPRTLDELRVQDLQPYSACFERELDLVMTAHVVYPAISKLPATCTPAILTSLLRGDLGFEGLVLSDDCDMEGFRRVGDIRKSAATALEAGVDVLLCCRDPELQEEVQAGLHDYYQSGTEAKARIHQALERANLVKNRILNRFDNREISS
jgi:beta-N-acetylhexosaminidase